MKRKFIYLVLLNHVCKKCLSNIVISPNDGNNVPDNEYQYSSRDNGEEYLIQSSNRKLFDDTGYESPLRRENKDYWLDIFKGQGVVQTITRIPNEFRSNKRLQKSDFQRDNTDDEDRDEESQVKKWLEQIEGIHLSYYKNNILYYISGYIVNKMLDKTTCEYCRSALLVKRQHKDHNYVIDVCEFSSFTTFVDRGQLKYASKLVYEIVKYAEKLIMTSLENAWENAYGDRLLNIINQHFYSKLNELFNPPHMKSK
ncbi:unnamed protein product, partial [Brenthis ino]